MDPALDWQTTWEATSLSAKLPDAICAHGEPSGTNPARDTRKVLCSHSLKLTCSDPSVANKPPRSCSCVCVCVCIGTTCPTLQATQSQTKKKTWPRLGRLVLGFRLGSPRQPREALPTQTASFGQKRFLHLHVGKLTGQILWPSSPKAATPPKPGPRLAQKR